MFMETISYRGDSNIQFQIKMKLLWHQPWLLLWHTSYIMMMLLLS